MSRRRNRYVCPVCGGLIRMSYTKNVDELVELSDDGGLTLINGGTIDSSLYIFCSAHPDHLITDDHEEELRDIFYGSDFPDG